MIEFFLQSGLTFEGKYLDEIQEQIVDFHVENKRTFGAVKRIIYFDAEGNQISEVASDTISAINLRLEEKIKEALEQIEIEAKGFEAIKSDYRNSI